MLKALLLALLPLAVVSFTANVEFKRGSALAMAPRFDKKSNKWVPSSPDEGPEAGYDIWGSLLRQGPSPFFNRLLKPDDYDQAVLKFMAGDKVDRNRAQAEMDAYLQNPNDWAYNRLQGYNTDYLTLDTKKISLTLTWAALITTVLGRALFCVVTGDKYWPS